MVIDTFRLRQVDGAALRRAREAAAISQATLAVRCGLTIRVISRAENGLATKRSLAKIVGALRIAPPAPPLPLDAAGVREWNVGAPR